MAAGRYLTYAGGTQMKLFLDQNKTLLPRVDTIFVLTRLLTLVGLLWFAFFGDYPAGDRMTVLYLAGAFTAHLLFFVFNLRMGRDLKLAYLSAIVFDLLFVPLYILYTGAFDSSLYLLFYLTISVAAYVLTFWFAAIVASLITLAYTGLVLHDLTPDNLFGFAMRVGFLWVYFLALTYASEYLRRSERRLMKLFDTLNMRTSELEKSQAQLEMIYENSRILAGLLDPDSVVREIMRILGQTLQYDSYAVVFRHKRGGFYYRARSVDGKLNYHPKALDSERSALTARAADMQEAVRLRNISTREDYEPLNESTRAIMIVPMTSHAQTQGILIAESAKENAFSEHDVKLLTIVARSAALALENAELHQRTEELTIIDELTEAYNYRYFVQKLQEEKKRAVRYNLPLSII
ncbi:MAG: GAF domain-containing protein, partial [Candidatus Zixiibacteriota bacterium]